MIEAQGWAWLACGSSVPLMLTVKWLRKDSNKKGLGMSARGLACQRGHAQFYPWAQLSITGKFFLWVYLSLSCCEFPAGELVQPSSVEPSQSAGPFERWPVFLQLVFMKLV